MWPLFLEQSCFGRNKGRCCNKGASTCTAVPRTVHIQVLNQVILCKRRVSWFLPLQKRLQRSRREWFQVRRSSLNLFGITTTATHVHDAHLCSDTCCWPVRPRGRRWRAAELASESGQVGRARACRRCTKLTRNGFDAGALERRQNAGCRSCRCCRDV